MLLALVLQHTIKVVDTSRSLLRDTVASFQHIWIFAVHKCSKITAIVENQVQWFAGREGSQRLLDAPVVLVLSLALPSENRRARGGNSSSRMVLR